LKKNGTIYIGLNDNYHDTSISILNEKGEILYSEGLERYLQYKRGLGCPPDLDSYIEEIFKKWVNYNGEDVVIVSSWTKNFHRKLKLISFLNLLNFDSSSRIHKYVQKKGVHPTFHQGLSRQISAMMQSGLGIYNYMKTNYPDSVVRREYQKHHLCHITHAIHSSHCNDALGLVIDGGGDETSITAFDIQLGQVQKEIVLKSRFSVGSIYSVITHIIGYSALKGEEWKVMGLSGYGKFHEEFDKRLRDIFRYSNGEFSLKSKIIGGHVKKLKKFIITENIPREDIAFTGQKLFEEYLFYVLDWANKKVPGKNNIIISGGAALNSLAMGRVADSGLFERIIIPNGPADDGNSIGAAILSVRKNEGIKKFLNPSESCRSPYTGSEIKESDIKEYVKKSKLPFKKLTDSSKYAAELLYANKIIGWIQGRAEFGPRALGNRSILANPSFSENKDRLNRVVKFRESYRPFAPSILHEYGKDYFENYSFTPYMEKTLKFLDATVTKVPAVVHENGTGRLQSVTPEINKRYYDLISNFNQLSGIPIVINTSYNVMGKPIAHSINDVIYVFLNSKIDAVIIGDYCLERPLTFEVDKDE